MHQLTSVACLALACVACTDPGAPGSEQAVGAIAAPPARTCPAPVTLGSPGDCTPVNGLTGPVTSCTSEAPCVNPIVGQTYDSEINQPTSSSCGGDPIQTWPDADGTERWACIYRPPVTTPRPLLVYFPPSLTDASVVYQTTSLRTIAPTFDLSSGQDGPGYVLATIQPRNLTMNLQGPGQHWDFWYRDLGTDTCNPDVRSVDTMIDALVAQGGIDPDRIYVTGWSNGAFFAAMYAIARHATPTPGGSLVASTAFYSGADPFGAISGSSGSCALAHYPITSTPILDVHRSCDLVSCNSAQDFQNMGVSVQQWFVNLVLRDADRSGVDQIINATGASVNLCDPTPPCNFLSAVANHVRWPNGTHGDTVNWEPAMLNFLAANPL